MEERLDLPRLLVAAPASGSGKTTVTCALLRAFQRRGLDPCAFKCGPDYIDPMFHREVLGLPSRNLDLFFGGYGWRDPCGDAWPEIHQPKQSGFVCN